MLELQPRQWLGWMLAVCFGMLLSSCAPAPTVPNNAQTTPTMPDEQGPVVIRFFTTEADPAQLSTLHSLIAEYQQANPDVEIDIVLASPTSRGRRLLTALAAGTNLGIFEIEPALMSDWVEKGYLLSLDDVVDAIGRDDYVAGSLFTHDGAVYAIPYATSVYGLWIRTDLLAEHGFDLPETYADVVKIAAALTSGDTYGIALPAGQNIASVNYFSTFLWQNGGDYFTCDGKVAFGSQEALTAVQKWSELLKYAPPGAATWGYAEQIDAFVRGQVAMVMYAGRLGVNLAAQAPELEDRVTVIFPPWGPEPVTLGVWSRLAIAAGTRHPDQAKAFLEWLLSGDRLLRFDMAVPGHMIPPLASVQNNALAEDSAYVQRHADWLRSFNTWVGATNHPVMNMGSMHNGAFHRSDTPPPWANAVFGASGIISTMLQDIALNAASPEAAWQRAVSDMEQTVDGWEMQHPAWTPPPCN